MRATTKNHLFTAAWAVVALSVLHIARPVAVSGQENGSIRATASVLPAEAAWVAQDVTTRMVSDVVARVAVEVADVAMAPAIEGADVASGPAITETVAPLAVGPQPAATRGLAESLELLRAEEGGVVAWVRNQDRRSATLTVAHLGN